jgi:hypothetical protein
LGKKWRILRRSLSRRSAIQENLSPFNILEP